MRNTQPIYRRGGEGGYHRLITRGNAERVAGSVQVPITTGLEPNADVLTTQLSFFVTRGITKTYSAN